MKHQKRLVWLAVFLLITVSFLCVSEGFAEGKESVYAKGDSAAFVRAVADAVSKHTDTPELFYEGDGVITWDLTQKPTLQPYFVMGIEAETDSEDPGLVHCKANIPGVVYSCFNMAYDESMILGLQYSKLVTVEGDIRVVTDEKGARQIDISGQDNVFAAYVALRYINPLYFLIEDIDISSGLKEEDFSKGLNILLNVGCDAYAKLLGVPSKEYAETVVVPELQNYQEHIKIIVGGITVTSGLTGGLKVDLKKIIWIVAGIAGVILLVGAVLLIEKAIQKMKHRGEKKNNAKKRVFMPTDLVTGKMSTGETLNMLADRCRTGVLSSDFSAFCNRFLQKEEFYGDPDTVNFAGRMAVMLAEHPDEADITDDMLRLLCKNIHLGTRYDTFSSGGEENGEKYRNGLLTAAGWSAVALGRLLARKMAPGDIEDNLKNLSKAVDQSNAKIQDLHDKKITLRDDVNELNNMAGMRVQTDSPQYYSALILKSEIDTLKEVIPQLEIECSKGLGGYMLDNGDLPLGYLIFLLRDSQHRIPRFIRQGVVMGLVDWLMDHRAHPEAAKLLETVISVRADMIRSDSNLTFFEVRVPEGTSQKDYALLMKDVLHCANPSVTFCDTEKLLSLANSEIPGVMDMLYACPLRLIDPVNRQTQGFYHFKPYEHGMWTQYIPPLRTGKVISRYHEVDDRTKPLSSGLNLSLFRDIYSVIPTLYHEYQHFKGNPNEASVFLKTHLFSIRFYGKNKDAKAGEDAVFVRLTGLFGPKPGEKKLDAFNQLIGQYYGRQMKRAEAEIHADSELSGLNMIIDRSNQQQTWDPDVRMPRLDDKGDRINRDLIRDIVVHYATVPKSITADDFRSILRNKDKTLQEIAGMPVSHAMEILRNEVSGGDMETWLRELKTEEDRRLDGLLSGTDAQMKKKAPTSNERKSDPSSSVGNKRTVPGKLPAKLKKYLRKAASRARNEGAARLEPRHLLEVMTEKSEKKTGKKR